MHTLPYQNYIFDLYGTLVDIHTDEDQPAAWAALARFYSYYGARYAPDELRAAYLAEVGRQTAGREGLRRDSHEAHPEIELAGVFQALFQAKGAPADKTLAVHAGQFFRAMTTGYLRLYDGVPQMLAMLRAKGGRLYLLSNAQAIFTAHEMRALGLADAFDAVYLSSDCGCKKPDRRFFRLLLDEQRLDPARSIMVGNDPVCEPLPRRPAARGHLRPARNGHPPHGGHPGRGSSAILTGSARARQGRGVQHAVQTGIVHRQDIAGVQPFKGPRREVYFHGPHKRGCAGGRWPRPAAPGCRGRPLRRRPGPAALPPPAL